MNRLPVVFVILAALCWGISGGIGGILTGRGWDPLVVSFYRGAIGLLFVLVWLCLRPRSSGFTNSRLWLWSVLAGIGVAGNFTFYYISIAQGSVAVAATLMYCAPVFVYLTSFALGFERPSLIKWFAIAMVILGVLLLTGTYKNGAGDVTPIAIGAGLLSGLSYALFIFSFKYAASHGSPQSILVIAFAMLSAILMILGDLGETIAVLQSPSWPLFLVLGVVGAGLSFIIYIVGLKQTAPAIASVVAMVEPITASLFGVLVLSQNLCAVQILGMVLILVTVTVLSVLASTRWV